MCLAQFFVESDSPRSGYGRRVMPKTLFWHQVAQKMRIVFWHNFSSKVPIADGPEPAGIALGRSYVEAFNLYKSFRK